MRSSGVKLPSSLQETKKFDADRCVSVSALTNSGTVVGSIKDVRCFQVLKVQHNQGTGGGDFQRISSDRRCAMCCFGATP